MSVVWLEAKLVVRLRVLVPEVHEHSVVFRVCASSDNVDFLL